MQSSVADELLAAATKKAEGEILRDIEEMISSVTVEKDRETEEAVERAISECGRGLDKEVLEERSKFKA